MKQQFTKLNIKDINRHWLVWLKPDFDTKNLSTDKKKSILKHINNDLPFVCGRFTSNRLDSFNLGHCNVPNTEHTKPGRYLLQAEQKDIRKFRAPLLISEVAENIPKKYTDNLNKLIDLLSHAGLPEPHVFGSYLWQSITGEPHIRSESDLDLIVYTNNIEDMCIYTDVFMNWEQKFNIKIDCEFCIENNIFFSSKEFFNQSKQLLIKTKNSVNLIHKKDLLDKLQSNSLDLNQYPTLISSDNLPTQLAYLACKSLYTELAAFPKPGLVSFYDTGSHSDMDHTTFTKSIQTLYEYFKNIADSVMQNCIYREMVEIGIKAENKMLAATGGINTHKGAIFSLGLLVAATAKTLKNGIQPTPESIQKTLLDSWSNDIINHTVSDTTHGRKAVKDFNANGILKEVSDGLPIIFNIALPSLQDNLKKTKNWNASLIQTFFIILSVLDDTNILYRGGEDALSFVRNEAVLFLENNGIHKKSWHTDTENIHQSFIKKKLSPGGCADMLACTVFLFYLNKNPYSSFGYKHSYKNRKN